MPIRADTLFEVLFPRALAEKKAQLAQVDGTVMFTVVKGNPEGVWTFDLRKGGDGKVHVGAIENPDLNIVIAGDFLDDFMGGQFDPAEAVENGKLGIVGNQEFFLAFMNALLSQGTKDKPKAGKLKEPKSKGVAVRGNRH